MQGCPTGSFPSPSRIREFSGESMLTAQPPGVLPRCQGTRGRVSLDLKQTVKLPSPTSTLCVEHSQGMGPGPLQELPVTRIPSSEAVSS